MEIDCDPAKDAANRAKHGLSLERGNEIDLRLAVVRPDLRRDYREPRWLAYGMLDGRMHVMAFTLRDGTVRAISLRRANRREIKRYG